MARISIDDVKAWVEDSKLDPQALDLDHLDQIETEIFARINSVYNTTGWVDRTSTPRLIQVIIAKYYTGWLYDKFYSENQSDPNQYAQLVKQNAENLILGILDGTIEIPVVLRKYIGGQETIPGPKGVVMLKRSPEKIPIQP